MNDKGSPLVNITIELQDDEGSVIASVATDSKGYYEYPGVPPGNCGIMETNARGRKRDERRGSVVVMLTMALLFLTM